MSLSMFKNKKNNMIIAVSLIVAIVTVTTYVPEMFEKRYSKKVQEDREIKYEEPQTKVESARKILNLTQVVNQLDDVTSKEDIKQYLGNMSRSIAEINKSVRKEVKEAKKKTNSNSIINRADEYQEKVEKGLGQIDNNINKLSQNIELMDADELGLGLKKIVAEIDEIQKVETPEVKYNDEAHRMAEGYDIEKIVGEQLVDSNYANISATPEANDSYLELNDEIRKIADDLNTPAEVYEYVRNNYQYKQYTGLRLGAIGTFEQKAGNDFDQAALLIALYKYKGYDAKFVVGNIDIDIDKAMNWLGVKTEKAAVNAMSMLGVPTQYGQDEEGNITKLRIEHTWVKVQVPYDSYRGAGKVKGDKIWGDVDPSFKQYLNEDNNEFKAYLYDHVGDLDGIFNRDAITINDSYTQFENLYTELSSNIEGYVEDNDIASEDVGMVLGLRYIKQDNLGYLPNALPYSVVKLTYEKEILAEDMLSTISFGTEQPLYGKTFLGEKECYITLYSYDLYSHRVTLDYEAETKEDEKIIESYGSIYKTPSYMVRICPTLKIDENTVMKGKPQVPGSYVNLRMDIKEAGIDNVSVENPLIIGGSYAITFDYDTIRSEVVEKSTDDLRKYSKLLQEDNTYLDEAMSSYLCAMGESYWALLDIFDVAISSASEVRIGRSISEAITGYCPEVSYIFGMPIAITEGSLYIDIDTDTMGVAYKYDDKATSKGKDAIRTYMFTSGIIGSYLEGEATELATGTEGVSSISIINTARARGIDILTLTAQDLSKLDTFKFDNAAKSEIRTALQNGKTVIVPEEEICYYQWRGIGYIITDLDTGEAAYMISGGICGGTDSSKFLFFNAVGFSNCVLQMAFTYETIAAIVGGIEALLTVGLAAMPLIQIIGLILAVVFIVFVIIGLIESIYNLGIYNLTGDEQYGWNMIIQYIMSLLTLLVFKVLFEALRIPCDWIDTNIRGFGKGGTSGGVGGDRGDGTGDGKGDDIGDGKGDGTGDEKSEDIGSKVNDSNIKYWRKVLADYGENFAKRMEPFGEDGKALIEIYEESGEIQDIVDIVNKLSESDANKAIKLMCDYLDDAVYLLKYNNTISLSKTLCEGLTENRITIDKFEELKLKSLRGEKYSQKEIDILISIREKFTINSNTTFRKIITSENAQDYINGKFKTVQGYVSRAEDYNDIGNFADIFDSFRLDYDPTPYTKADSSYWKIEFKTTDIEKMSLENAYGAEFGGINTDGSPCTRNGFLGSENGKVIPEWRILKENPVEFGKNSEITRVENGKVIEVYEYYEGEWSKIK